jgi:hypothetical protein
MLLRQCLRGRFCSPSALVALLTASPSFAQSEAPAPENRPLITINEVSTSDRPLSPGQRLGVYIGRQNRRDARFRQFLVSVENSFTRADGEKNCEVLLNVHYPAGYSYTVIETTYHGYAQLDPGVTGNIETEYTLADENGRGLIGAVGGLLMGLLNPVLGGVGDLLSVVTNTVLGGGREFASGGTFTVTDTTPQRDRVVAPCGGKNANLRISTHISRNGGRGGNGVLSDEDATFSLTQQVHMGWERCR